MTKIKLIPNKHSKQIMIMDSRSHKNGKIIEKIGVLCADANGIKLNKLNINTNSLKHWLAQGALPTKPVLKLLVTAGLM